MAHQAAQQLGQLLGVFRCVVLVIEQDVLEEDAAVCRLHVVTASVHQPGDRVALVDRHRARPGLIVRGVQRYGEVQLVRFPSQLSDFRDQPHGGNRKVPGADVHALGVVHHGDRAHGVVVVCERLAHAHEHDVGDLRHLVLLGGTGGN